MSQIKRATLRLLEVSHMTVKKKNVVSHILNMCAYEFSIYHTCTCRRVVTFLKDMGTECNPFDQTLSLL